MNERLLVECGQVWRDPFGKTYIVRTVELAYGRARVLQDDNSTKSVPLTSFINGALMLVEPDPRDLFA